MTIGILWCRSHGRLEERGIAGNMIGVMVGDSVCNLVGHPESGIVGRSVRRFVDISQCELERV